MRISFLSALLVACGPAATVGGADLTRLERTINREPAYGGQPGYCLLVFGQEAKTRVWLVLDGDVLYVDRNGNGDLTELGERSVGAKVAESISWNLGDIVEADGRTRHTNLRAWFHWGAWLLSLRTADGIYQEVGNEFGPLRFSERAQNAPIVHLAGPLTFLLAPSEKQLVLIPGEKAYFIALVGTAGLGEGAAAYSDIKDFGKTSMVAEVEFPRRTAETPLRVRGVHTDY
jgi:hypothetical protein